MALDYSGSYNVLIQRVQSIFCLLEIYLLLLFFGHLKTLLSGNENVNYFFN